MKWIILLGTVCLGLSACVVGPNYVRPSAPVTAHFKEAKNHGEWKVATPQEINFRGEWWRVYNDNQLNQLELQLNYANQNIVNAYYNYKEACALVAETAAAYFPTLTGTATVNRQKGGGGNNNNTTNNINTFSPSGQNNANTVATFNNAGSTIRTVNQITFNAAWELDIWGAVRRAVEASVANAQANAALLAATRLSMQASLAQFYYQLRGIDADLRLLNATVESYRKSLRLTQIQYEVGTIARADVLQAQALLDGARSQAINTKILRAQYEHAIAVLIGIPPAAFCLKPTHTKVKPPVIPVMVPSALLERRPDIAQAERLMAQANAQIGVAVAAFFPSIQLTAAITGRGTGLTRWWSLPATAWSYGGELTQLILDGGERMAAVAAANANYCATVASYRQTVLAAFQDVEDNLASLYTLNQQIIVQRQAANNANKALAIVNNQYKAGTVPYVNVMISQVQALNAEKNAIDIDYQRMVASVNLIRSLGGGWDGSLC